MELFEGYYSETLFKIFMSTASGLIVFFGLHLPVWMKVSTNINVLLEKIGVAWFYATAIFSFVIAVLVFQGKL